MAALRAVHFCFRKRAYLLFFFPDDDDVFLLLFKNLDVFVRSFRFVTAFRATEYDRLLLLCW